MDYKTITFPFGFSPFKTQPEGYYFDEDKANHVISFFEKYLTHTEPPLTGKPFLLESWQKDLLATLYGFRKPNGERRFERLTLGLSRVCGKSMLAAGISLHELFFGGIGSEIIVAAFNREQSKVVIDKCLGMTQNNKELDKRVKRYRKHLTTIDPKTDRILGTIKSVASKSESADGLHPTCIVLDEVWAQTNTHLFDTLRGSQLKGGLLVLISHAGFDRSSLWYEQWEFALRVAKGEVEEPELLPVIYTADEKLKWDSEEAIKQANPNLNVSVRMEKLKSLIREAKESPSRQSNYERDHLNRWTQSAERWLDLDLWEKQEKPIFNADDEVILAIDMSTFEDICSLACLRAHDKGISIETYNWLPENTVMKRWKQARVPYPSFVKSGALTVVNGDCIDDELIRIKIHELAEKYYVKEIVLDRYHNALSIAGKLRDDDGFEVIGVPPTLNNLHPATLEFERMLKLKTVRHPNNPVLNWAAGNACVHANNEGKYSVTKGKSIEKIDPIIAILLGVSRLLPIIDTEDSIEIEWF